MKQKGIAVVDCFLKGCLDKNHSKIIYNNINSTFEAIKCMKTKDIKKQKIDTLRIDSHTIQAAFLSLPLNRLKQV